MSDLSSALRWPWVVEAGELSELVVPVLDGISAPVDVSGWAVSAQVKSRPGGTVLYSIDGAPDGTSVRLTIPAADSAGFTFRRAWYRVMLTDPDGKPLRLVQGPFVVSPG